MGIPIAQAQADATNICTTVKTSIRRSLRVVALGDYPGCGRRTLRQPYALLTPGLPLELPAFSAAIGHDDGPRGGDLPERQRTFFEAYSDSRTARRSPRAGAIHSPASSSRLGDATPHSAVGFGSCVNAPTDDFGRDGAPGVAMTSPPRPRSRARCEQHHPSDDRYTTAAIGRAALLQTISRPRPAAPRSTTARRDDRTVHRLQPRSRRTRQTWSCRRAARSASLQPDFPPACDRPQTIPFVETITAPTTAVATPARSPRSRTRAGRRTLFET